MKLLADLSAATLVQRPPTPANTDGVTFSILMAAYRAQEHIGAAVASVLAQTRTDWELIIVDDHSPDKLGEQVAPFRTDPRIGYVRLAENGGCSVARNVQRRWREASISWWSMLTTSSSRRSLSELRAKLMLALMSSRRARSASTRMEWRRFAKMTPRRLTNRIASGHSCRSFVGRSSTTA